MGQTKNYPPCIRFAAAFSRYNTALEWCWKELSARWGTLLALSPAYEFVESKYYHATMGDGLYKQFGVFEAWYDPANLADDKRWTNSLEELYQQAETHTEPRPLNIDPGYMAMTKLVLASTKNREHRLYLRDGIYAEVTLAYRNQAWQPMSWTYPDYQREDFRGFFEVARAKLARRVYETRRSTTISEAPE